MILRKEKMELDNFIDFSTWKQLHILAENTALIAGRYLLESVWTKRATSTGFNESKARFMALAGCLSGCPCLDVILPESDTVLLSQGFSQERTSSLKKTITPMELRRGLLETSSQILSHVASQGVTVTPDLLEKAEALLALLPLPQETRQERDFNKKGSRGASPHPYVL